MAPPLIRVSYSRAQLFEKCPARFHAEHVDGDGVKARAAFRVQPIYLTLGVFLHEVLDRYVKHLVATKQTSDWAQMEVIFDAAWAGPERAGIPEEMYDDAKAIITNAMEGYVFERIEDVIASELPVAVDREWNRVNFDSKQAWLRARIDLVMVDGPTLVIRDFKSGRRIDDAENHMQLKLYARLARVVWPAATEIRGELFYGVNRVFKQKTMEEADFVAAQRWIEAISARIQSAAAKKRWPATPGRACLDCPIFDRCPSRAINASVVPPTTLPEAEELLSQLVLIERSRKDILAKLKTWVEANGALVVNGMMADFATSAVMEYPIDKLKPLLEAHGIDVLTVVKSDSKALAEAVKATPALEEELRAIAVNKSHSKFGMTNVEA